MLTKAAAKFDAAFANLPAGVRSRVALAVYRVWPAWQQYQRDLGVILIDPKFRDACWDLAIAAGFRLVRKQKRFLDFSAEEGAELIQSCPVVGKWAADVAHACETGTDVALVAASVPAIEGKKR